MHSLRIIYMVNRGPGRVCKGAEIQVDLFKEILEAFEKKMVLGI